MNKAKVAPNVNIVSASVHIPFIEKEDRTRTVNISVDNSGKQANFPKCYWKLILKNGKEYSSQEWVEFMITEEDELTAKYSYFPANYPIYDEENFLSWIYQKMVISSTQ